jgi:hypothetical protein
MKTVTLLVLYIHTRYKMITNVWLTPFFLLSVLSMLFTATGCSPSDEKTWEEATRTKTFVSYQNYINRFPQGVHITEAQKRIELTEIQGTVVDAANGKAIKECQMYFIEVGSDGTINATLTKDLMGVSDELGKFTVLINRTKLSKMQSIAFIFQDGGNVRTSPQIKLGKIPDDAMVLDIGTCKIDL